MAGWVSQKPLIVRIAAGEPALTLRFRLAAWLRTVTARLDPGHTIIIVTDDRILVRHAIDGCVKLMVQKQAIEMCEQHEAYLQACALANWTPDDEGRPQ